ncbi:hypothetical protein ACFLXQ_07325 [Chloroflexota bacterium]
MRAIFQGTGLILLLSFLLSACSSTPTPDIEATVQAAVAATQAAQPPNTSVPTDTPEPPTPTLIPTNTPEPPPPTNTPVPPTDTPAPTNTSEPPTDTPTPAPPTSTFTPTISPAKNHFEQGLEYFDQEQWEAAIVEFEEVVRLDPGFSEVYLVLGYSYDLGPKDLEKSIESLEKYLQLVPNDSKRAEIEADIAQKRTILASQPTYPADLEVPEGKALFVVVNSTGQALRFDIGPHNFEVSPNVPPNENTVGTFVLDPGTYSWIGIYTIPGNMMPITDATDKRSFEFTVAAGDIYAINCCTRDGLTMRAVVP